MRILLAGLAKTGNVWVEQILASAYDLNLLASAPPANPVAFQRFVAAGEFPDDTVFHQHFAPSALLLKAAAAIDCHLVSAIRNPYDVFVSLYHYAQRFSDGFRRAGGGGVILIDKPIDDPDVLDFLRYDFGNQLDMALRWVRSDRSIIVRYEDLHTDPVPTVRRLTNQIRPVSDERIEQAIAAAGADLLRRRDEHFAKHIRAATVGDWKNHLSEVHLEVFRSRHADVICHLGYEVL
jgi:hypothetical protein